MKTEVESVMNKEEIKLENSSNSKNRQFMSNELDDQQVPLDHPQITHGLLKMLLILSYNEQRLITFTSPESSWTVQEILSQVGFYFSPESNIECIKIKDSKVNYVVKINSLKSNDK